MEFQRGLTNQFPVSPLRVVYSTSGSQPAAAILRNDRAVVDTSLYWASVGEDGEAYYLLAFLNSETLRLRTVQFQARGQFGARHFHKVVFNLPIPVFDGQISLHRKLADAGLRAEAVTKLVEIPENERFVAARQRVRRALIEEGVAGDIEKLVEKLLDGAAGD